MPTVTLTLESQRKKSIPDRVVWIEARGRFSGPLNPSDIKLKEGEIVLDLVPDRYTVDVEIDGFKPTRGTLEVGSKALVRTFPIENLCTVMPTVGQIGKEQRRLLETLDGTKTPGEIWHDFPDNKAATFFQITHALAETFLSTGEPLSSTIDRIVRLGGSELTAPDQSGTLRTVIGWRMHVVFVGGASIETQLSGAGFKRDSGVAHPTHKRFGFVRSFREKQGAPRLQIVTNHEGSGADVDLDAGKFHQSAPHDVYKDFKKRFPSGAAIYVVK